MLESSEKTACIWEYRSRFQDGDFRTGCQEFEDLGNSRPGIRVALLLARVGRYGRTFRMGGEESVNPLLLQTAVWTSCGAA